MLCNAEEQPQISILFIRFIDIHEGVFEAEPSRWGSTRGRRHDLGLVGPELRKQFGSSTFFFQKGSAAPVSTSEESVFVPAVCFVQHLWIPIKEVRVSE